MRIRPPDLPHISVSDKTAIKFNAKRIWPKASLYHNQRRIGSKKCECIGRPSLARIICDLLQGSNFDPNVSEGIRNFCFCERAKSSTNLAVLMVS